MLFRSAHGQENLVGLVQHAEEGDELGLVEAVLEGQLGHVQAVQLEREALEVAIRARRGRLGLLQGETVPTAD